MSSIGPIVSARHAEQAIIDTLRAYMPVYLADRATDAGLPASKYRVASYARAAEVDTRFPSEALPCVVARATSKSPRDMDADTGAIGAAFTVIVGVAIADRQRVSSSDIVWDYLAAIEAVIVQHGALGGFSLAAVPGDSEPEDLPVSKTRTLAAGTIEFTVIVGESVNAYAGPDSPPDDPYEPLPDDLQVQVAVVNAQPE